MKKQVNIRLNEYDIKLIEELKKRYMTNSTTEVIIKSLEYTSMCFFCIPDNIKDKKMD